MNSCQWYFLNLIVTVEWKLFNSVCATPLNLFILADIAEDDEELDKEKKVTASEYRRANQLRFVEMLQ
jgi:hypothetical protein